MESLYKIKKRAGAPLVFQLTEELKVYIRENCNPREKFFSERKLSSKLGYSRVTIGKVVSALVHDKILYQIRGSGTYVAEYKPKIQKTIAVIVYHSGNPFFSKIVHSIQEEMAKIDFHTILVNSKGNIKVENAALKKLKESVDGIIVAPALDAKGNFSSELRHLIDFGFPVVVMCHTTSNINIATSNTVLPNFRTGGYIATKHLIEKGYKKILFFAIRELFHRQDIYARYEGYRQALADHNIKFSEECLVMADGLDEFNGFFKDGYKATRQIILLLEENTAVLSIGDSSAIGLLKGLREKGLNIPRDVGLCGFDDIDLASQWGIELTTVRVSVSSIGKESTRILTENINGKKNKKPENVVSPVELVVRKTT